MLGDSTVEPTRTDAGGDDDGNQQGVIEDRAETAASAANPVEDTDGRDITAPVKSRIAGENANGSENEETVEQLFETFAEVKEQQDQHDESDCTTCSQPIRQHNLRRKSVSTLRRERQNFDGKWTNASSLAICKDCGQILDTNEVQNPI